MSFRVDHLVLVLDVHLGAVEEDLRVHLGLDLLDGHFGGEADVEALALREVKIVHVADAVEDGVGDGLVDGHALAGVEHQRLLQEVLPVGQAVVEDLAGLLLLVLGEGLEVVERHLLLDEGDLLLGGSADDLQDLGAE